MYIVTYRLQADCATSGRRVDADDLRAGAVSDFLPYGALEGILEIKNIITGLSVQGSGALTAWHATVQDINVQTNSYFSLIYTNDNNNRI